MLKKIILYFIAVVVSLVFIFGAYVKLYPIEPFELSFVDTGMVNWFLAPIFARILIGLEFLIGIMFLFNIWLKRYTYNFSLIVLSLFILYLIIQIILFGNKGNCGCFGQFIEMTPLQAIFKNILILGLILILFKFHKGIDYGKYTRDLFFVIIVSSFALPFILNPLSFEYSETYLNKQKDGYELKLDLLYENALINQPPKSLSKGKHIISFLSLTCSHCRIAAKKLRIIHNRNPEISMYFVLNGKEHELEEFFDDTRSSDIPFCRLKGKFFIELAGAELPVIYLVNNSIVEHSVDYDKVSEDAIIDWYKE